MRFRHVLPRMSAKRPAKGRATPKQRARKPAKQARSPPPARTAARSPAARGAPDGAAQVRAFIASLPAWQRGVAERFDGIIAREVPGVRRAVKWGVPFYGIEGRGWFASFGAFTSHVKLNFFRGTSLKPVPPKGASQQMRALDLREEDLFPEPRVRGWVQQASRLPGWAS